MHKSWADMILNGGWDRVSEQERMDMMRAVLGGPCAQAANERVKL